MNRMNVVKLKLKKYTKTHPRFKYVLSGILGAVLLLILLLIVQAAILPSDAWLPDTSKYTSDDQLLFNAPVKAEKVTTKYGRAVRYTTTDAWQTANGEKGAPWTAIYEFHTNKLLQSSACPNVTDFESLLPSGCDKLGEFQGSPVYSINRSLPSTTTEYFANVGDIFIYIKMGGEALPSLNYIKTFTHLNGREADAYLSANAKRVDAVLAKQRAQKAAADYQSSVAYARLTFTPVLPSATPEGWDLSGNNPQKIEIDGPNVNDPKLINAGYMNKSNHELGVSWHVGKLSDFQLDATCGPSPGYGMENLDCHKVAGTNYYEAAQYDDVGDFVRLLYYPVGDSLVITSFEITSGDLKAHPTWSTELSKAQDTLTQSAKPVSLTDLKGSTYSKLYF